MRFPYWNVFTDCGNKMMSSPTTCSDYVLLEKRVTPCSLVPVSIPLQGVDCCSSGTKHLRFSHSFSLLTETLNPENQLKHAKAFILKIPLEKLKGSWLCLQCETEHFGCVQQMLPERTTHILVCRDSNIFLTQALNSAWFSQCHSSVTVGVLLSKKFYLCYLTCVAVMYVWYACPVGPI